MLQLGVGFASQAGAAASGLLNRSTEISISAETRFPTIVAFFGSRSATLSKSMAIQVGAIGHMLKNCTSSNASDGLTTARRCRWTSHLTIRMLSTRRGLCSSVTIIFRDRCLKKSAPRTTSSSSRSRSREDPGREQAGFLSGADLPDGCQQAGRIWLFTGWGYSNGTSERHRPG